ncbi:unnamed protein product [Vitrella brassicaformis CCMP3155]|uniref:Apple domain-containing protein n=2 Tax=Vitrella brassicaformis TaxID=1169539 RepID=A0A0G4E9C4_VITBC|nr:unnamed protein product [Vitrella brassicaformis CCMP3155]|eukprot:CEL91843.1 unnamed protein product [Vitrella brassicaformis CCMP3155]
MLLTACLVIGGILLRPCQGSTNYGEPAFPDEWIFRPSSCSYYYYDPDVEQSFDNAQSSCWNTNTSMSGDLLIVDDSYEAQWVADQIVSAGDHGKKFWAAFKRHGVTPDGEPPILPEVGGTKADRHGWYPAGEWEWTSPSRGLWDIAWRPRQPWDYNKDYGRVDVRKIEWEEPWRLALSTKDPGNDNRAICEKKLSGCTEHPTVMITTPTSFPDPKKKFVDVTLTFSDDISDLTFPDFSDLTSWQCAGGVNAAIEGINYTSSNVIEERLWPVQPGWLTLHVPSNVFTRTSDGLPNTPSNTLIVYSGCNTTWGSKRSTIPMASDTAYSWWHCGRLCYDDPTCEMYAFDAQTGIVGGAGGNPDATDCLLYGDTGDADIPAGSMITSVRTCATKTDTQPPEISFVRKIDRLGDEEDNAVPGGAIFVNYDSQNNVQVVTELHFSDLVENVDHSDLEITWTNGGSSGSVSYTVDNVVLEKVLKSPPPSWDQELGEKPSKKYRFQLALVNKPAWITAANVTIGLKGSSDITDYSGNTISPSHEPITFVIRPRPCDTMKILNDTDLAGGDLIRYGGLKDMTFETCAAKCRVLPECEGFAFGKSSDKCYLKWGSQEMGDKGWQELTSKPNFDSAYFDCSCAANCFEVPLPEICGDFVVVGAETCDDGNTAAGDGCSETCQTEPGWTCPIPGEPCFLVTTTTTTLPPSTTAQPPPATTAAPTTGAVVPSVPTAPPTIAPQPETSTTEPPMAPTTGAPPVVAPPVDVDDVTDNLDDLKNQDAVDVSDAEDTIGGLLGGEGEEPPTPPPVESPNDFSSRLLKAINVAKVARKEDMAGLAKPNSTQEETKAQRKAVVKALMRNLQKAAVDRSTKLSDVSSSPAEVLLSAVTLVTTVETADETENDDMDTAEAGVATFKALAAVSADTISQPDDTPANAVKELQGLQYYLDGAAGLLRQLNRTAKADRHLRRLTPAANESYHTLSSDIIGTTAQLADSLATRAAAHSNGTAEVAGAKTRLKVARTDTASGATLTIKDTNVVVDMPSLPSIPPAVCADGGGLRESVQMTLWADDPYAYAADEEPMADLTANDTLTNAAQGTLAVSARQCGSDLQLTAGDGQQEPFRLFIPRPSADSVPAAGNVSVNGTERAYDVHVVCGFWNTSTHQWDTQGCQVNLALSNETTLCCECTHLTEFSSLFRSVIVDSHIAGVVGGAGDSLARMADITAWTQNIAAFFVSIMIAIHSTCLLLSLYFDCKNPITDQLLLDIWMTDPLLDTRHKARSRLQRSINGCVGRRCYHPWWCDFLVCRIFGGIYMHCRNREPTLHLQELRTLRAVRSDLLQEGEKQATGYGSFSSIHEEHAATSVVRAAPKRRASLLQSWMGRLYTLDMSAASSEPETREKLRSKVHEEVPSLSDFVKHTWTRRRQAAKKLIPAESTLFDDVHTAPKNWSIMSADEQVKSPTGGEMPVEQPTTTSQRESEGSSPRKRAPASVHSRGFSGTSVEEERTPAWSEATLKPQDLRDIQEMLGERGERRYSAGAGLQGAWIRMFSFGGGKKQEEARDVSLIKSGVLKEALRKRLLLELQRQQAAAVLIQRSFSAILERQRQQQQQQQRQAAAESLLNPTVVGLPQTVTSLDNIAGQPQDKSPDGSATDSVVTSPISLGREEKPNVIPSFFSVDDVTSPVSPSSPLGDTSPDATGVPAPLPTTAAPGWSQGVDAMEQEDTESSRPELRRDSTKSVMISIPPADGVGKGMRRRSMSAQATRRKSVTQLWVDLNAEVDLMVTRTLRRVGYVEWGAPKMFREVCRRDHPLLKLFILNPTFTAVQRTLFFGSISLGILTMCAVFFDQGRYSRRQDDSTVLMAWQSGGVRWLLTLRQIAVLIWSILLSKPIPLTLLFLFRKAVPHIIPSATREEIKYGAMVGGLRAQQKMTAQKLASLQTRRATVTTLRRIADLTGRHSGHFSLERKIAVLARWRLKERIGITIGFLYWFACCSFLLLFAFSSQLVESGLEGQPSYLIYQDFVMVCSVEFLNSFILQPIIFFCLLSLLLMAVLRVASFDWVVWSFPHWFDFTFSGAQSLHELTVQLQAISDTHELTRGLVGFAGLNVDSVGMVQDVFSF